MSTNVANLVAQIFAAVLIAQLVEDRSLSRAGDTGAGDTGKEPDETKFVNAIFLLGLVSSAIGMLISLLAVLRLTWPGTTVTVACAICLLISLFAMVVPAAHRLPELRLPTPRWVNEMIKSVLIMVLVLAVAVAVYKFAAVQQPVTGTRGSP